MTAAANCNGHDLSVTNYIVHRKKSAPAMQPFINFCDDMLLIQPPSLLLLCLLNQPSFSRLHQDRLGGYMPFL